MRARLRDTTAGGFALLLACVLASPVRAQVPRDSEPTVERGMVAVRVLNRSACLMGIRVKANGVVKGYVGVEAGGWRSLHVQPDPNVAVEVEVLADPRLCGVTAPEPSAPASVPVAPVRPIQRARYHHFPVLPAFGHA